LSEKSRSILADTSVWIEFFKQNSGTGDALETLILEDAVWTCGVVLFELAQGVKSDNEKLQVLATLSHLKYVEMSKALWQKAGDLSASLRKNGQTLPHSDIFIAVIAIEHNLSIFTLDGHFKDIPGVKLHKAVSRASAL
jgi:predicted nucleic acid-binding protein